MSHHILDTLGWDFKHIPSPTLRVAVPGYSPDKAM
jgi:hypothetical protein